VTYYAASQTVRPIRPDGGDHAGERPSGVY
jgi:hypothetical protein